MKTAAASRRFRPAVCLALALLAPPVLADATFRFTGNLGNLSAEADVIFSAGQMDVVLINTGDLATAGPTEVLTGAVINLPGAGDKTLKKPESITGSLLPGPGPSLKALWSYSSTVTGWLDSDVTDLAVTLESGSRSGEGAGLPTIVGIVSAATPDASGVTDESYSLARDRLTFRFKLGSGSLAPEDFGQATVTFLFGNQSLVIQDAPVPASVPLPEPRLPALLGLALTASLLAKKRRP